MAVTAETYPGVIIVIKDVTYNVEAVEHHERLKPGGLSRQDDRATIAQLRAEIARLRGGKAE